MMVFTSIIRCVTDEFTLCQFISISIYFFSAQLTQKVYCVSSHQRQCYFFCRVVIALFIVVCDDARKSAQIKVAVGTTLKVFCMLLQTKLIEIDLIRRSSNSHNCARIAINGAIVGYTISAAKNLLDKIVNEINAGSYKIFRNNLLVY